MSLLWIEKYRPQKLSDIKSQNNIVNSIKKFLINKNLPHLLFFGSSGTGKCHGINTPILMYDGTIKMVQNIKQGELIMGDDSTPRQVLSLARGIDDMYEISNSKGDRYIVNKEHILCLKYKPKLIDRQNRKSFQVVWFDKKIHYETFSYKNKDKNIILKFLNNFIKTKNENIIISVKDFLNLPKYIQKDLKGYKTDIKFNQKQNTYKITSKSGKKIKRIFYENENYKLIMNVWKRVFDKKTHFKVGYYDNKKYIYKYKNIKYNKNNRDKILLEIEKSLILKVEIKIKEYLKLDENKKKYLYGYKIEEYETLDPYLLGLWLGDGSSAKPQISNQDACILQYLSKKLLDYDCYLNYSSKYDYYFTSLNTTNKIMQYLQGFQLINNKHIPHIYKCNSKENRLKLLAGLIDSDGHYNKKGNYYEITQKNNQLSNDIIFLCRSLGFACYSKKCKKSCMYKDQKREGEYNRITIYGDNLEKIPVLCLRKKARERKQIKNALVSGIKVKSLGRGNYYGFELDKNHKYILGNFIVTHNTSCIHASCKQLYGKNYKYMILELNASDNRGIETVRNQIYEFSNTKSMINKGIKTVILDEADSMTIMAQNALRKIIENKSENVRFCIICNYINNIIPALKSRCIQFRFSPLKEEEKLKILKLIIKNEKFDVLEDYLNIIIKIAKGDMRKSINMLQSLSVFYKNNNKNITKEDIYNYFNFISDDDVNYIWSIIYSNMNLKEKINKLEKFILYDKDFNLNELLDKFTEKILQGRYTNNKLKFLFSHIAKIQETLLYDYIPEIVISSLISIFIKVNNIK